MVDGRSGSAWSSREAAVLLLVLAQVFLPRIAASRISSRVGRYGTVQSVSVKAWPAVKLLWGDADSVRVQGGDACKLSPAQTAKLLWEARGMKRIRMTALAVQGGSAAAERRELREARARACGRGADHAPRT